MDDLNLQQLSLAEPTEQKTTGVDVFINASAEKWLLERLLALPEPVPRITHSPTSHEAVFTGSFVVKAFFPDSYWQPGDIDIVTTAYHALTELFRSQSWMCRLENDSDGYASKYTEFSSSSKWFNPGSPGTINIIGYSVEYAHLGAHIDKVFDFDGCAVKWHNTGVFSVHMDISSFVRGHWHYQDIDLQRASSTALTDAETCVYYTARYRAMRRRLRTYVERNLIPANLYQVQVELATLRQRLQTVSEARGWGLRLE